MRRTGVAVGGGWAEHIAAEVIDIERHVAELERTIIKSALRLSNGVQTKAAEMLKLSYRSFRHLIKKYDL